MASTVAEGESRLNDRPDCVILDLMLPDGDGITLLEKIRTAGLPIRVVVTTGVDDPSRLDAVQELKPEALLNKPIDLSELLQALGMRP